MTKVSILGATGYAGAELVKLILQHPNATLTHITSESHTGQALADVYPHMRGITDLTLESMDNLETIAKDSDFIFIALPHGHAMTVGKALAKTPVKIIDLGADYRFSDTKVYEAWYHVPHTHPDAPERLWLSRTKPRSHQIRQNHRQCRLLHNGFHSGVGSFSKKFI